MADMQQQIEQTVLAVSQGWLLECGSAIPNEDGWTGLVIDPVFRSAGWGRLDRADFPIGSGSAFEWPTNRGTDVALFSSGEPVSFIELRRILEGSNGAKQCLIKKLREFPALQTSRLAIGSWFRDGGGLALFEVVSGRLGEQLKKASFKDPHTVARILRAIPLPRIRQSPSE